MKLTFLGTGTSQGIPIIGCQCPICQSDNPKDKRLRTSVLIELDDINIVIDSGPDFRQQILKENVRQLDAVIFTHDHKDHTGGLDDVRAFNYIQKKPMEVYGEKLVLSTIKKDYDYAFAEFKYPGVPEINLNTIENKPFKIGKHLIEPIRGLHYKLPVLGFKIDKLAYITDMNSIEDKEVDKIKGVDTFVINALRIDKHISHFTLEEALAVIEKVKPKQAFLTHISHNLDFHDNIKQLLPEHVEAAYDGLKISI
jgi:phosphoribosyl 1,2-cyclic phosphate phosphodiesterase